MSCHINLFFVRIVLLCSGEPNDWGSLNFYLDKDSNFQWRDTPGSHSKPYICESAAIVVPGTSGDCGSDSYGGSVVSTAGGCTGSTPEVRTCPGSYTLFNGGCYKYVTQTASCQTAANNCRASSNGWLATLNTQAKLGIVSLFVISEDVWFGLYKSSGCAYSACDGLLRWDTYPGTVAPVGNYTLNMKRYVC